MVLVVVRGDDVIDVDKGPRSLAVIDVLAEVGLDRKILADLAAREPSTFMQLCDQARSAVEKAA